MSCWRTRIFADIHQSDVNELGSFQIDRFLSLIKNINNMKGQKGWALTYFVYLTESWKATSTNVSTSKDQYK